MSVDPVLAMDPKLLLALAAALLLGLGLAGAAALLLRLRRLTRLTRRQREALAQLNSRYHNLRSDYERLQTQHLEHQHQHEAQIGLLNDNREHLRQEFENLANRIFEARDKSFTASSRDSLQALLQPFREQISGFQQRIDQVHSESLKGNATLESELRKVLEIGLQMSDQANNLAQALKGDNKIAGNWGEAQLERSLELAGLVAGEHYETQSTVRDRQGRRWLPDLLIKLPDRRHLVIDSKVSLVAWERAVAADTEEEQQACLDAHSRAVRQHVDELAGKDYANLPGMGSPDFVLMFMPVEPAYIAVMQHNRELFNYGYQRGVVLVSHTTLMPVLRTVANLWMVERSNAEAREISRSAGEIYNQVCHMAERLQKLGQTLQAAGNHYNRTVTSLTGKQGLAGKVERFQQLSTTANKTMPSLEPLHNDIETERLDMVLAEQVPPVGTPSG
ncbi:DNA recombination protein RmuC [Kineobactrum salinum]|nr:DNA recombination protein RmuC [Kineobactrum salinum]